MTKMTIDERSVVKARPPRWPVAVVWLLLLTRVAPVAAHGGEDHGPPAALAQPVAGTMRSAEATTTSHEAVVRWQMKEAGAKTGVAILLADFASSAPLSEDGTKIELRWSGPADVRATARATAEPGTFAAEATFPVNGHYTLVMTVTLPGGADILLFPEIDVGPPEPVATPPEVEVSAGVPMLWLVLAIGLGVAFALFGFLAGRRRGAATLAIASLIVPSIVAVTPDADAHGGEDHGPAAPATVAAAADGAVALPLESQFLLGLRTGRVAAREISERLRVTGRVTAPPGAYVRLSAPNASRLEVAPGRAFPRLGERVSRGDVLAILVELPGAGDRASIAADRIRAKGEAAAALARSRALRADLDRKKALTGIVSQQDLADAEAAYGVAQAELKAAQAMAEAMSQDGATLRLPLVAPIDGIVARIDIGPGAVVAPDDALFALLDATTLWVAGAVFESDLGRVDATVDAVVTADTLPTQGLVATPVAASPAIDPVRRTQDLVFEVAHPSGLRLEQYVWLDLAAGPMMNAMVVPAEALVDLDGRPAVWVKTGAERFEPRRVAVVATEGAWVGVKGALLDGERVVTSGAAFLRGASPAPAGAR